MRTKITVNCKDVFDLTMAINRAIKYAVEHNLYVAVVRISSTTYTHYGEVCNYFVEITLDTLDHVEKFLMLSEEGDDIPF